MPGSTQGPSQNFNNTSLQNTTQSQSGNQTQSSSGVVNPYAPTQPLLQSIIDQLSGQNTGVTPTQSAAVNQLIGSASSIPNFGNAGTNAVNNAFGFSTAPQQSTLDNAYSSLQGTLTPYTAAGYTNPYSTPGFSDALNTMNQDITNQVNGEFAAAGRSGSPANTQALARGLSQGEGGLISNEFNTLAGQQLGAAGSLYGAGSNTATTGTNLALTPLQTALQGINSASAIPGLFTAPATSMLGAANTQYSIPYSNISTLEGLTTPLAGLGQSTSGTGTSAYSGTGTGVTQGNQSGTVQQSQPLLSTLLGAGLGTAGLLGANNGAGWNALGSFGNLLNPTNFMSSMVASDERVKENIKPVGVLLDGSLPVYSYNYVWDPSTTHIGLLAQDVEEVVPEAVGEVGGVKAVDYKRATARAAQMAA